MKGQDPSHEATEARRSNVRVRVTYAAAAYVFGGSALLILALWIDALDAAKLTIAKDVFMMVLPVATGVITYWFASRKPPEKPNGDAEGDTSPTATSTEDDGKKEDGENGAVEAQDGDDQVVEQKPA